MTEENQVTTPAPEAPVAPEASAPAAAAAPTAAPAGAAPKGAARPPMGGNGRPPMGGRQPFGRGGRGGGGGRPGGPGGRGGRRPEGKPGDVPAEADYEEKNVEVSRVTRVTKGGKRMRFRILSVIGNRKGRVGYGVGKGLDVAASSGKATTKARKALFTVPLVNDTIPHMVEGKFAAARVLLKPAPRGTGVKAGGAVRIVLELAGVPNVVSKALGSKNKINNVKATFVALRKLRPGPAPTKEVKE